MSLPACSSATKAARTDLRQSALVDYLRAMVIPGPHMIERFHAVFLDERHAIIGDTPMGVGEPGSLSVRMRGLFKRALALDASGLIIAHNHPSGQCRPSHHDIESTRRLKEVATRLDIEVIDHLIITRGSVYSMRAGGNL